MSISDLNQCTGECHTCIKRYIKKHTLVKGKTFDIPCFGIPKEYVSDGLVASLGGDKEAAVAIFDPVTWAGFYLDWYCVDPDGANWKKKTLNGSIPTGLPGYDKETADKGKSIFHRTYQAEMLRCLHGDTSIFMADGTVKQIRDINIGDKVITYNENRKTTQSSYTVLNKWDNGFQDVYKIELNNGDTLKVTENHPILSWFHIGKLNKLVNKKSFKRVYKSLEDGLSVGDKVYTLNQFGVFGEESNIYAARLFGYIVSDGYVNNSGQVGEKHIVEFSNTRKQYVEEFADLVEGVFGVDRPTVVYCPSRIDKNGIHHKEYWKTSIYNRDHILLSTLREIGCINKTNRELSLLSFAFQYNKDALSNFLNRCWSGDGCIYNYKDRNLNHLRSFVSLNSGNMAFLELFRILLKKIGIYTSHIYVDQKQTSTTLNLSISRIEDIETFLNFTDLIFGKETQSNIALTETSQRNHNKRRSGLKTLSRTSIKRIEYIGKEKVWDIEVDTRHNFIANGIVVHNCTSKRKVFRLGRQCLAESSLIQLWDGTIKSIKDIRPGDKLLSLNQETSRNELDIVVDSWNSGKKPVFKIKTKFGHEIVCSDNHPFYSILEKLDYSNGITIDNTSKEWKTISDGLNIGHKIAVPVFEELSFRKPVEDGIPELIGYFLADGCSSKKQSAKFTNINKQYLNEFTFLSKKLGSSVNPYPKGNGFDLIITNGSGKPNPVRELLRDYGLIDILGPEKRIPKQIFTAPKDQIRTFINRFWSGDGYVSTFQRTGRKTFRTEIGNLQENRLLLEDLQRLLWRFGVHGYIKSEGNNWRYVVSNKLSIANFLTEIGPIFGKEIACEVAEKNLNSIGNKYCKWHRNILWDHISSIEYVGEEETYDIEVEKNHNFIANGIYTHNSGKTEALCIAILHSIFTNTDFKVVVIAPFQAQIDLIFTRLTNLISGSPLISGSVKRNVKAPNYQIMLHNNSKVTGFTAGTRSGQAAGASRGQSANMLVFDEADYLCAADIDAALAIISNFPNATVWMSSTPTGKRERFFNTCHSSQFREFHYPSQTNPNWTDELDALYKDQLTEDGYKHEILAEFGEQEEGVYQAKYIEAAQANYEYKDMIPQKEWTYMLGCDWNDPKIGTTIAVIGYSPDDGKFFLCDKHIVSRGGRTQLAACEKIAQLNRIWNPAAIYVDRGYGTTQVEILHEYGHRALQQYGPNHPDGRLRNVKAYDFGGSVEVHDLITKQPIKKHAKPFLIENSVRRFESGTFRYPKSDESYTNQLLGYIIDRVTDTGRFVYKQQNEAAGDHFLDAVNLAFVGFTLEKTKFGKPIFNTSVAFTGRLDGSYKREFEQLTQDAEYHRPKKGRSDLMRRAEGVAHEIDQMPGNNMAQEGASKIWRWEGFGHDAPRPIPRTNKQAFKQAEERVLGKRGNRRNRPKRTKF